MPSTAIPATPLRLTELAERFPTLLGRPGVRPWRPERLDAWAAGREPCEAALLAAQFVLSVHNATATWHAGVFNVARAVATWDREHRAAFAAWAADPWLA